PRPRGYRGRNATLDPAAPLAHRTDGLGRRPALLVAMAHGLRLSVHLVHGPRLRQPRSGAAHPGFRRQQVRPLPDQRAAAARRTESAELPSGAPARAGHFAPGGPVGCGDDGAGPSPQASAWERGLTTITPIPAIPASFGTANA